METIIVKTKNKKEMELVCKMLIRMEIHFHK